MIFKIRYISDSFLLFLAFNNISSCLSYWRRKDNLLPSHHSMTLQFHHHWKAICLFHAATQEYQFIQLIH